MSSLSLHSHSSEYVSSEAYCTNFGTLDPLSEPDFSRIVSFGVTEHMFNKVWTCITSLILVRMRQMRCLLVSLWNIDDDGVVACEHQRSYKEVMLFWSCSGLLVPTAKETCLLAHNSWWKDKRFLDSQVGDLPKVLEVYKGEAVWPAKPTPRPNGKTFMSIGPTWGHSYLVWLG